MLTLNVLLNVLLLLKLLMKECSPLGVVLSLLCFSHVFLHLLHRSDFVHMLVVNLLLLIKRCALRRNVPLLVRVEWVIIRTALLKSELLHDHFGILSWSQRIDGEPGSIRNGQNWSATISLRTGGRGALFTHGDCVAQVLEASKTVQYIDLLVDATSLEWNWGLFWRFKLFHVIIGLPTVSCNKGRSILAILRKRVVVWLIFVHRLRNVVQLTFAMVGVVSRRRI